MQNRQLFINGLSVDFFSDDEDIQLVFQVNTLGDLESLENNYSKAFKLPLTQKNREILGFPDDITITTNEPYEQLPAKLVIDGIEIIANGIVEIIDTQDNYADVLLLSGNCQFLDLLGGDIYAMGDSTSPWSGNGANKVWDQYSLPNPSNLSDINNCIFDVIHAASSQNKTSGWIWPVIDYGQLDKTDFTLPINVRNMRPAFFLHSAIELLVRSAKYTIDYQNSSLTRDPLYNKILIPFSNSSFDHGSDFQNTPDTVDAFSTVLGTQFVVQNGGRFYNGFVTFNAAGIYNGTYYQATKNINGIVTVNFNCVIVGRRGGRIPSAGHVYISVGNSPPGSPVVDLASQDIFLDDSSTVVPHSFGPLYQERFVNQTVSVNVELVQDMQLFVRYDVDDSTGTIFIIEAGATFNFVVDTVSVLWQQPIQCERILPDVGQLDLIKCTLQMFGSILIADANTGTVRFISLKDIIANKPIARDWSSKCVDMGKSTSFQLSTSYSQINWLRYLQDTSIPNNFMPPAYADDKILINDKTLNPIQPESDLFNSLFAPSLPRPYLGGFTAQICSPTNTDEFAVGGQPRILIDNKLDISKMGGDGQPLNIIIPNPTT